MQCRLSARGVGIGMVVALVGCRSPLDDRSFSPWIEKDPTQWQVNEQGAVHTSQTLRVQADPASEDLFPELPGAGDYVRLALQRSPAIQAARSKVERLNDRVPQATSLDDPRFTIAPFGDQAETAAGQVELMTSISQKLPTPGKLSTRGKIAQQAAAMATQELAQTRLRVVSDTRRAYWSYYYATRAIEVVERDHSLLQQFHDIAEAKYKAGSATQQDVLRASVELSHLDHEQLVLQQQQTSAVAMLNRLLDRATDAPLPLPNEVDLAEITTKLDTLLSDAAQKNPRLQQVHERIEMERQRLKLARLNRRPDLTVSLTYNAVGSDGIALSANGEDQWWLGFGINLPIWAEKQDAAEREALHGMFEGIAQLTDESNDVAFRVQDALVKVETQQRLVILFRDVIIPQAQLTIEASQSGYRTGQVDFLTVISNWRQRLDFELFYHQSQAQLEQHFADLQYVVGHDLARQPASIERQHHE